MTDRDLIQTEAETTADGPRVGLASYDTRDPEATFRPIEPVRPKPGRRPRPLITWSLRFLFIWAVNLVALGVAGLLVTSVGSGDPFTYVFWATAFAVIGASLRLAVRRDRGALGVLVPATALLAVEILTVWLMTVAAPPFHSPDGPAITKAALVMWLANLPLWLLLRRRPTQVG